MADAPIPRPGDTHALQERDYLYGLGPVIAVIIAVTAQVEYDGEPWWQVDADVANGTPQNHGGWLNRSVYVRASSLNDTRIRPLT